MEAAMTEGRASHRTTAVTFVSMFICPKIICTELIN